MSRQQKTSAKTILGALILILVVASIAAAWTITARSWFSFALEAIAKAGENPPASVARHLEQLVQRQEYANAALVGVSLLFLLRVASMWLSRFATAETRFPDISDVVLLLGTSVAGGATMAAACLAFRSQPVGSQDLVLAATIHACIWGVFGALIIPRGASGRSGYRQRQSCMVAGVLWGFVYFFIIVFLMPGEYVERLFSKSSTAVGIWAGGGTACLLIAYAFLRKSSQESVVVRTVMTEKPLVVKG